MLFGGFGGLNGQDGETKSGLLYFSFAGHTLAVSLFDCFRTSGFIHSFIITDYSLLVIQNEYNFLLPIVVVIDKYILAHCQFTNSIT